HPCLLVGIFRRQSHHYVKPHLARGLEAWLEAHLAQNRGGLARHLDRQSRGRAFRIDIEQQPVGTFQVSDARRPDVNRDCGKICDVRKSLLGVEKEVADLALRLFGPNLFSTNPRWYKRGRILLIERLARDTIGISREHHGPILEIGQHPSRNRAIVRDQVAFRVTRPGKEDFIRMRHGCGSSARAVLLDVIRVGINVGFGSLPDSYSAISRMFLGGSAIVPRLGDYRRRVGIALGTRGSAPSTRRRKLGCLTPPLFVHSVNLTSQTSSDRTKRAVLAGAGSSRAALRNGDADCARSSSIAWILRRVSRLKPVPTLSV